MHPSIANDYIPIEKSSIPSLVDIIKSDPKLKYIYDDKSFIAHFRAPDYDVECDFIFDRDTLKEVRSRIRGDFYIVPMSTESLMCISYTSFTSSPIII